MNEQIEAFLEYLRLVRNASPHTLNHYSRDLQSCAAFLGRAGVQQWPDASVPVLRRYVARLHEAQYQRTSIARMLPNSFRFTHRVPFPRNRATTDTTDRQNRPKKAHFAPTIKLTVAQRHKKAPPRDDC